MTSIRVSPEGSKRKIVHGIKCIFLQEQPVLSPTKLASACQSLDYKQTTSVLFSRGLALWGTRPGFLLSLGKRQICRHVRMSIHTHDMFLWSYSCLYFP